jgi:hypothetical protein
MKKTILVLMASVAGFIAVWRFEPAPQSADIDAVSGMTQTSESDAKSSQAALDAR